MGIIAWVGPGLVAGLFANLLIPGRRLALHPVTRRGTPAALAVGAPAGRTGE